MTPTSKASPVTSIIVIGNAVVKAVAFETA
jgi:hypothetical protein